jgi:nucleotide-binding universal stress UspA family protein
MSYKTILVHLNHEQRARRLLETAGDVARHFCGHLIGLHVFPAYRLSPPVPLPFSGEIAAQIRTAISQENERIKAVFDEVTRQQPYVSEWRSVTSQHRDPASTVLDHARSADVVISSQADPDWRFSDILDFPERIAIGAGRPTIVVPNFGEHRGMPRNVVVAWSRRREAARAVADSLPLLKSADKVHLISVTEGSEDASAAMSDEDIRQALIRHGVNVQASRAMATEFTVGEEIRVRAIDLQADMIVMGCYGHSRLREYALGGVTRHMLREMTIPVLFSH